MNTTNPLLGATRLPKVYIKLPSGGKYWPEGSLNVREEYPVYSMTARDELQLKVPDALLNGEAVVAIMQSCMPDILNGWEVPSIDMDTILIAIRIASYGEVMSVPVLEKSDKDYDVDVDLRNVLDDLQNNKWDEVVPINDNLTMYVKPLPYKLITVAANQAFETQKLINMVADTSISEEVRLSEFKKSFTILTNYTIDSMAAGVYRVDIPTASVTDAEHIREFISGADREVMSKLQAHLDNLASVNQIKPISIAVTDELRELGITGEVLTVPLNFDPSNFFVQSS